MGGIEFLNRIDEVAKDFGITRSDIGVSLGISKGTMSTWKSRNVLPIADTANRIADELGVSTDWLLKGTLVEDEILRERTKTRERIYDIASEKYGLAECKDCHDLMTRNVDLSYNKFYNWTKGRCEMDYSVLKKIASNLDVSVMEILEDNGVSYSASINPYFNRLDEWQKEAVIWDMKMNLDLRGEYSDYQIELENSGLPFPAEWDTVIPEEEWLVKEVINHKGWEGNFTGFNLDDEGQKRHYQEVFSEYRNEKEAEFLEKFIQEAKDELVSCKGNPLTAISRVVKKWEGDVEKKKIFSDYLADSNIDTRNKFDSFARKIMSSDSGIRQNKKERRFESGMEL